MAIESIITRMCTQTAVYWGSPTEDGYGTFTYAEPIEILCRWEDKNQVFTELNGTQIVTRSEVHVTQDVDLEGLLYLGDLDDLDSTEEDDPMSIDGIGIIKRFDKIPVLRSTDKFLRKAFLAWQM